MHRLIHVEYHTFHRNITVKNNIIAASAHNAVKIESSVSMSS